jgi:hypothetical protein
MRLVAVFIYTLKCSLLSIYQFTIQILLVLLKKIVK